MTIAFADQWIWDSWYVRDGDLWHGFFLQADKALGDPDLRHCNVSQGHATSRDLVDWTHLGTTFAPAAGPAWDDCTTWTGSVVQGDDGLWHLFYTGTQPGRGRHAAAHRPRHLPTTFTTGRGSASGLVPRHRAERRYEEYTPGHWHDRAMRDPWVMRDPDGDGWLMYFTARVPGVSRAQCRRRHRLCHLARSRRLDARARRSIRRRLRPDGGAAGLRASAVAGTASSAPTRRTGRGPTRRAIPASR